MLYQVSLVFILFVSASAGESRAFSAATAPPSGGRKRPLIVPTAPPSRGQSRLEAPPTAPPSGSVQVAVSTRRNFNAPTAPTSSRRQQSTPPPPTPTSENSDLTKKCELPSRPSNGHYLVDGRPMPSDAEVKEYTVLAYKCDDGYEVNRNQNYTFCISGKWSTNIQCLRSCTKIFSYTLDLTCRNKGDVIDCDGPMNDGVTVTMKCKPYHSLVSFQPLTPRMVCSNGEWSRKLPFCVPDCGEDKAVGQEFILEAPKEINYASPWHVGVYKKEINQHKYICGGTIVSNKLIISAAHCFDAGSGNILSEEKFAIAAGKLYGKWNFHESYEFIQKTDIEKIHVPEKFYGHESLLQNDIAVVVVKESLRFSNSIYAACLDVSNAGFVESQLEAGKVGKVVGWGVTEEGNLDSAAGELKVAFIPVVDFQVCKAGVPHEFTKYTSVEDKFCAGDKNQGTTICNGDSGGGFLTSALDKNVKRYYLMGVVSNGPLDTLNRNTCVKNSYTLFTRLSSHASFLENIVSSYI